MNLASQKT